MTKNISKGNFTLKVQFNLRQHDPVNEPQSINAIVRFNNKRIVISGIDKCEPRYWNCAATEERENSGRKVKKAPNPKNYNTPKQHSGNPRAREISRNLSDAKSRITEVFDKYTAEYNQYPVDLKAFQDLCRAKALNLPEKTEVRAKVNTKSLIEYIEVFIKDITGGRKVISSGKNKGQPFAKTSRTTYNNLLFNLNSFIKKEKLKDITFNDIDLDFYTDFRKYLIVDRNLSPGYFGDMVKALKSIMTDSLDRGFHNNVKYKSKHFIKESVESDTVFLNKEQLQMIHDLDLSEEPAIMDKARNLFLIGCYSGLRFSDYSTIKPENVSDDFLRIRAQKTKDYLSIPVSRQLREILSKYPDLAIDSMSNQKLNSSIKKVCEKAGLTHLVSVRKFNQGKEVYVSVPFYELVSSHTARRSWATNAFKDGYPTLLIQAITGHRTESAFLKYIRLNNEDKAVMMLEMMRRNELKVVNGGVE